MSSNCISSVPARHTLYQLEAQTVFVDDTGLKFIIVTPGATGSWFTMPLRSAPGNLDKYPHMLMVLGLMENRFDGI